MENIKTFMKRKQLPQSLKITIHEEQSVENNQSNFMLPYKQQLIADRNKNLLNIEKLSQLKNDNKKCSSNFEEL